MLTCLYVYRMLLWTSVCWPLCAGVWYLPGSRKQIHTKCNTALATAAARIYWRRNLTRCIHFDVLLSCCLVFLPFLSSSLCWVLFLRYFVISLKDPMIKGQRCVILADGFYEWMKQDKVKQPFFIYFPQTQGDPMTSSGCENSASVCPPKKASPDLTEVCFFLLYKA